MEIKFISNESIDNKIKLLCEESDRFKFYYI